MVLILTHIMSFLAQIWKPCTLGSIQSECYKGRNATIGGSGCGPPTSDKYYQQKNKTVYLDPGHSKGKNGIDYKASTERTVSLPDGDSAFKGDKPLLGQGVESKSPEDKYNWDVAQELKDILLDRRCFVYKNILIKGELR